LPQVCNVSGNPDLLNYSAFDAKGAMVYDTCAGKIKRWSGSAWVAVADSGAGGGGSGDYVDTIYRKAGQDSIFYTINGGTERAVKDSVGSGGGGGVTTMANIGAAPNAAGSTISGSTLTLQPASASFGGVVTTAAQTFAGTKTFGTITPTLITQPATTGVAKQYFFDGGAATRLGIGVNPSEFQQFSINATRFTWNLGGDLQATGTNELMRLNSTGLSIGTTSSVSKLTIGATSGGEFTGARVINSGAGTTDYATYALVNNASALSLIYLTSSNYNVADGTRASGGGWANSGAGGFSFLARNANADITFSNGTFNVERLRIDQNGGVSIGSSADAAASSIVDLTSITKGFLRPRMTTAQRNAIASPAAGLSVYNTTLSTNDVYTTAWYQQPNGLTGSGTLDFPSTGAHSSSDLTITVTGAAVGDIVMLGTPVQDIDGTFTAFVSAANTVTVRFNHYGSGNTNPASGTFKVYVIKN
jgi:hypothetical protein